MTIFSKTIGASGADYTTADLWQAARIAAAESSADDEEEAVFLDGDYSLNWTLSTSWPAGVIVRLRGQNSHELDWEVASGGAQLTSNSSGVAVRTNGTYSSGVKLEIVDLVVQAHPTTTFRAAMRLYSAVPVTIKRSLVRGSSATGNYGIRVDNGVTLSLTVDNSILLAGGSGYEAIHCAWTASQVCPIVARGSYIENIYGGQASGQTINMTLDGCLIPTKPTSGATKTATECITSTADWSGWTATDCESGVSFVDADPSAGQVAFVDRAGGNYRLRDHANNLAIDFCPTADMPTDDALGATRDATPDCGPYEVPASGDVSLTPAPATYEFSTPAATVTRTEHVTLTPAPASYEFSRPAPSVTVTDHVTLAPAPAQYEFSRPAPLVGITDHILLAPAPAYYEFANPVPAVTFGAGIVLTPGPASYEFSGPAALVGITDHITLTPAPAQYEFSSPAPLVLAGGLPTVTAGIWSVPVRLAAGDEWMLVATGPAADAPRMRVTMRFRE